MMVEIFAAAELESPKYQTWPVQAVYAAASSLASEKFISDAIIDDAHKLLVHQEGLKFKGFASILLLEISREERAIKTRDIGCVSYSLRSITQR